mmetsp:Transcript_89151/g.288259  ORF Transcript_89151/g.288259 Transcript_89151/m.288259 type:complete len:363 (+) Transcript_89151:78-1166(+)
MAGEWRRRPLLLAALGLARLACCGEAAYTCEAGEVVGEVQGETGSICSPKCADATFACPLDLPAGTLAQPQCMLQDFNRVPYCGLLCTMDSQCPSGAFCRKIGAAEVSLCVHPLSFKDWAMGQSSRVKLAVAFPSAGGTAANGRPAARGFELAKAYAALQSLKRRYGIADGDADVLTVKELLSSASSTGISAAAASGAAPAGSSAVPGSPSAKYRDFSMGSWKHDMTYLAGNVEAGLPGLEREVHDTVWNVQHLENYGVATELLRGLFFAAVVYFVGGAAYKHQALGARGIDMIPHSSFWMEYPGLVVDGANYSMALVVELLSGASARGGAGTGAGGGPSGGLIGRGGADRDSFSNFEPMKA